MSILRRLPAERFSEVLPAWQGATVVLVGGGPSLTLAQVALVAEAHAAGAVRVIAVNDVYLWIPWAEVLYGADSHWWGWQIEGVAKPVLGLSAAQVRERFRAFAGQKCTIQNSGENVADDAVHMLRNLKHPLHSQGLSLDPRYLATGRNSGYQALNLAVLAGAKTIVLLGFDGRPAVDGKTHWSGGHPRPTPAAAYEEYRRAFSAGESAIAAAGVRVINASPGSAIDSFPKMELEQALTGNFNEAHSRR